MLRYESIPELMAAMSKRGIRAGREEVEVVIEQLGLREPFGPGDLADLVSQMEPGRSANQRIIRVAKVLSSKEWSNAVAGVRLEIGMPSTGLPADEALELHQALLEIELGQHPMDVQFNGKERRPVAQLWQDVVTASRKLCPLLGINPMPIDELRVSMAKGQGITLFGVGKLLSPEFYLKLGGHEILLRPNQVDYLVGHVLWDLRLDPETMEPRPSVCLSWQRMQDGGGRLMPQIFNGSRATAYERKHLMKTLGYMERTMFDVGLIAMSRNKSWQIATWEQRRAIWNRHFPNFSFPTVNGLRKACNYAVKYEDKIRARFDKRMQEPVRNK